MDHKSDWKKWLQPKVEGSRREENEHKSELVPMLKGMTRVVDGGDDSRSLSEAELHVLGEAEVFMARATANQVELHLEPGDT